jgi:F-type H+-transporting ATPase subunit b
MLAAGGAGAMLVSQILAFAVLALVAATLVVPALKKIVGGRSESIARTFDTLERETAETKRQLEESNRRMAGLEQEARGRLERTLAEARRTRDQALADAAAQVQAALDKARREVRTERDKAVLELRQTATELTLEAADHLIQKVMDERRQEQLVDGTLSRLESARRT